ncbi:MAG: arsenate reductase [Glaciecola sp.]|jgi:arsenate reductase|uniref:arsenate reductase ArsC n=1 Tax=Congregibacter sp. TaxID=2744308 RepID=UPI0039E2877E
MMNAQEPTLTLLFICTHNRCRSVLCEALARHLSRGRIAAFSAGSQPSGVVHPETLRQLQKRGIDTWELRSESWDAYEDVSPDAVITVCDSAAGEQCPVWFGKSVKVHWGLADPSRVESSSNDQATAFDAVITTIEERLRRLLELDFRELETGDALRDALLHIAQ